MRKDWKDSIDGRTLRPESLMMGFGYTPAWSEGALKSPIFQTSTFVFETAEQGKAFFEVAYGLREADGHADRESGDDGAPVEHETAHSG